MSDDRADDRRALGELTTDLFARQADPDRVAKVEATADRFDRDLWQSLADAGLLGVTVPEAENGLGLGAAGLAVVLEGLGRFVAPVPLVSSALAGWVLSVHGSAAQRAGWLPGLVDGSRVIAVAASPSTAGVRADGDRLSGRAVAVAWAHVADAALLPVDDGLFLVPTAGPGLSADRGETTAREIACDLHLDGVAAERVGDSGAAGWLRDRHRLALAAVQIGVTDAAVRLTASYTSQRQQFGKPLSAFQAVALKAADAYLDTTAIRATTEQAAWSLDAGGDAALDTLTAAWWAAEAGQRCVHLTQHLHGGMGADITYAAHRYFLWGKQIELQLGGASALLAELGDALATRPDAGDAVVL